jgi:hypothetical protein
MGLIHGMARGRQPSAEITLVLYQGRTLDPGDDLRDGLSAILRQGDRPLGRKRRDDPSSNGSQFRAPTPIAASISPVIAQKDQSSVANSQGRDKGRR